MLEENKDKIPEEEKTTIASMISAGQDLKKNPETTKEQIKADKKYKDFALVKEARKSVLEVPEEYWNEFMKLSGTV